LPEKKKQLKYWEKDYLKRIKEQDTQDSLTPSFFYKRIEEENRLHQEKILMEFFLFHKILPKKS